MAVLCCVIASQQSDQNYWEVHYETWNWFCLAAWPFDFLFHFHNVPHSADRQAGFHFLNVVTLYAFTVFLFLWEPWMPLEMNALEMLTSAINVMFLLLLVWLCNTVVQHLKSILYGIQC